MVEMYVDFNATILDGDGHCDNRGDDWCEIAPKRFEMLISDKDLSVDFWNSLWQEYFVPTTGVTFFMMDLNKYQYKTGDTGDYYSLNNLISQPWDKETDKTKTLTTISIHSSQRGVLYMEQKKLSVTILIGSLWGFFSLVMTIFYICFIPDAKRPTRLMR